MTPRKRAPANLLDRHKADIQYSAGGLTIGISGVQASDAATVSAAILNAVRDLKRQYPELEVELTPVHGGGYEGPDEDGVEPFVAPVEAVKRVGFR